MYDLPDLSGSACAAPSLPLLGRPTTSRIKILKNIHLFTGLLLLAIFAITGQYMLRVLELPSQEMNAQRMLYRASHMYLFFAGALNVAIGCYWKRRDERPQRILQNLASTMIILSQPVLFTAFIIEPQMNGAVRDITFFGCLLILAGTVLTMASHLWVRQITAQEST